MPSNNSIHVLNAKGRFQDPQIRMLKEEARSTLAAIHDVLPAVDVDIVFCDAPGFMINGRWPGGYSLNESVMLIYLDPCHPDIDAVITADVKATIAHEYHHCCRWKTPGYGSTLGEALVSEGLADHFSLGLFGGAPPPWCTALGSAELEKWRAEARPMLDRKPYNHAGWFFGREGHIPRWAGYALAYDLVARYLVNHPGATAAGLVHAEAGEVLKGFA